MNEKKKYKLEITKFGKVVDYLVVTEEERDFLLYGKVLCSGYIQPIKKMMKI